MSKRQQAKRTVKTRVETGEHTPYTDLLLTYDIVRRNIISRWLSALIILMFLLWYPTTRDNLKRFDQICTTSIQPWLINDYGCKDPEKCDLNHSLLTTTSEQQMVLWYEICEHRSRHYHDRIYRWYKKRFNEPSVKIDSQDSIAECEDELQQDANAELTEDMLAKISSECRNRFNVNNPES